TPSPRRSPAGTPSGVRPPSLYPCARQGLSARQSQACRAAGNRRAVVSATAPEYWREPSSVSSVGRAGLSQFVNRRLESRGEFFDWPRTPVMEEVYSRLSPRHVIVDRDHVQAIRPECLEDRRHFVCKHRHVAGDLGIGIATEKGRPGVETHPGVNGRAHLLQLQIVATDRDLVDLSILLPFVANQLRNLGCVNLARRYV